MLVVEKVRCLQLWPVAVLCILGLAALVCVPQWEKHTRRVYIASVLQVPLETVVPHPWMGYFTVHWYVVTTAKGVMADVWMADRSTIARLSLGGFLRPVLPKTFVTDDAVALAALAGLVHRYWPNSPPDLVIVSRDVLGPDGYWHVVVAGKEAGQQWAFSIRKGYVNSVTFTDSR